MQIIRDKTYPHIESTLENTKDDGKKNYSFSCDNCKYDSYHPNFTIRAGNLLHKRFIDAHKNCKPIKQR